MSAFLNIEIGDIKYVLLICLKKKLKLIFLGSLIRALFFLLALVMWQLFTENIFPWLKLLFHGVTSNVFRLSL